MFSKYSYIIIFHNFKTFYSDGLLSSKVNSQRWVKKQTNKKRTTEKMALQPKSFFSFSYTITRSASLPEESSRLLPLPSQVLFFTGIFFPNKYLYV